MCTTLILPKLNFTKILIVKNVTLKYDIGVVLVQEGGYVSYESIKIK